MAASEATAALKAERDKAYRERAHLVAFLAACYPSVIGPAPDAEGWSIVYVRTPVGQMSWHVSYDDLTLFGHVTIGNDEWDGHTTEQKYERLDELTRIAAEYVALPQRYIMGSGAPELVAPSSYLTMPEDDRL